MAQIYTDKEEENPDPTIIIIAGPNGAGKTTFAREFLPQEASCMTFINLQFPCALQTSCPSCGKIRRRTESRDREPGCGHSTRQAAA